MDHVTLIRLASGAFAVVILAVLIQRRRKQVR